MTIPTAPPRTRTLAPARPGGFFAPIHREFDRLFDQLGNGFSGFAEFEVSPRVDVHDTKTAVEITVELPGLAREDVTVTVEGDLLTISGEKKSRSAKAEGAYRVSERAYGSFSRSFLLPSAVDPAKLTAAMKDGVLTLVAPKDAKTTTRTITIAAAT